MAHDILLSRFEFGGKTLRNRIVCTAHGEQWASGGLLNEHHLTYYTRRAQGGAGLLITFGSAPVCQTASTANTVSLWNPQNEPMLRELASRVHAHGALIMAQASHRGPRERPADPDAVLQAPSPARGADKLTYQGTPHVLTRDEIVGIVEDYARAAAMLDRAGYDGIEITALGTHLIEQFWSPTLNTRTDAYGGNFENRIRFAIEVLKAVDDAVSDDFLIAFRLSCDPQTDLLGLAPDDMLTIAKRLDDEGLIDLFDVSGGSGVNMETHTGVVPTDTFPVAPYADLSRRMKRNLSVPILMAGRILTPDQGEEALANESCDLVAMTRALIADPDLPARTIAGETIRIRPCIAINEGCRRVTLGRSLACSVNPAVADTGLDRFPQADDTSRVVTVVGGGPGGLEAARVAAERGLDVTLLEASDKLGGQMNDYAALVRHPHLLDHIDWLTRELERLGVAIELNTAADETMITGSNAAFIIATGAETTLPPEATALTSCACTDVDVIRGVVEPREGARVTVYDAEGRQRGALIAAQLAERHGAEVAFVFPNDAPCEHLEPPNRSAIFRRLAAGGISVRPHHFLVPAIKGAAAFRDSWSDEIHVPEADVVVFAGYRRPVAMPTRSASTVSVQTIGDSRSPRLLRNAISEATKAALLI